MTDDNGTSTQTQQGDVTTEPTLPIETVVSARQRVYEQIAKKRRAEMGLPEPSAEREPSSDVQQRPSEEEDPSRPVKAVREQPASEVPAGGLPDNLVKRDDGTWALKLKVDGEEVEQDWKSLVAGAQKLSAADRRLRDASLQQQEVNFKLQQVLARERELEQRLHQYTTLPGNPPDSTLSTVDPKTAVKQSFDALLKGDDEAAAEALAQVITASRPAEQPPQFQPNVNEVVRQQLQQERVNQARAKFTNEPAYQALLNDPFLFQMVDRYTADIIQTDPLAINDPYTVMVEAAKRTQSWLDDHIPKPAKAASEVKTQARQERKAAAIPPVAASGIKMQTEPEEHIPSAKERIADIQRSRGQIR